MFMKKPGVSGLVKTTVLNTKLNEVTKKVQDMIGLVTTTVVNTKIGDVENKIPTLVIFIRSF